MNNDDLIKFLIVNGYYNIININGRGLCGVKRFIYTIGLVIGLTEYSYHGRYCYESNLEAIESLAVWDGTNDPSGNWLKYKGHIGDRSNPLHNI